MSEIPHVIIYTDGACDPNPGPGGWAAILHYGSHKKELTGGDPYTTNNRMELTAAIRAIQALKEPCQVDLYTDSKYLQFGITKWLPAWKKHNWKRRGGTLANVDLWQALDEVLVIHDITWHWLKGHAGIPGNERADHLAMGAIPG